MKLFDKIFKKNKYCYKISTNQENNLVIMLKLNKHIKLNSLIHVPENFCAVILSREQLLDVIPSGEFELSGLTIPKSCKANKLDKPTKKGYKTKFLGDFYFVNLNNCKISNEFYIKKLNCYVNFELTFKIEKPKEFLKFLINEKVLFDEKFASSHFTFSTSQVLYYYYLDNELIVKDKLNDFLKSKLKTIGVEMLDFDYNKKSSNNLNNFKNNQWKIDDLSITHDFKNEDATFRNNENIVCQEKNIDQFKSLIDLNDIKTENITYFVCDECGAKLPSNSKSCYNCKKSFEEKNCCEFCGREIKKGIYVCPYCKSVLIGN